MNPRPTKRLKDGMIVTYKHGWIVPCGPRDKPRGVWCEGRFIRMADGTTHTIAAGVQVGGDCRVLSGKPGRA